MNFKKMYDVVLSKLSYQFKNAVRLQLCRENCLYKKRIHTLNRVSEFGMKQK